MSNVVLVYPPVEVEGRYKSVATGHEVPPQPLICLGAVLRQNNITCSLIDANALGLNLEQLITKILDLFPEFVGITAPTMLISTAAKITAELKKRANVVTLVGGPHMSAVPFETMRLYKDIDIGVIGEGEITLVELIGAIRNKKSLQSVKGIIYRDKDELKLTDRRPYLENLDSLPYPAWDMLPDLVKTYQQSSSRVDRLPCLSIITSRGCPYQCIFCARNVFGNVTRCYSADYIFKMTRYLMDEYNLKSISIEDENFVIFKKRLIEFCNLLISEKIDLTWDCVSSVNAVDPELLRLMKKAGCWQINFGIESGSARILKFIKKNATRESIEYALRITKEAGINTKAYFIIGHPTETAESIQQTIDFVKKIRLDIFQMSFMVPLPGSELYGIAHKYGVFENDWSRMNIWTPLFIPHGLTKEFLIKESKRAYREFYFRLAPIVNFLKRAIRPSSMLKFFKDAFKMSKFLLSSS